MEEGVTRYVYRWPVSQSHSPGTGSHGSTLTMSRSLVPVNSAILCLLLTEISELRWEKYQWARVLRDNLTT